MIDDLFEAQQSYIHKKIRNSYKDTIFV